MDAKQISFIAIMSSLGIVISIITLNLGPISLAVGGQAGSALDLSHIATFVAAIFGGPVVGATVGFLGGIYAGAYFGYVRGTLGLLSLIGLPIGKAMTGLLAGFLYKRLKVLSGSGHSVLVVASTLLSYVPESVYTVVYFLYMVALVNGSGMSFMIPLVIPKAWVEIVAMGLMMGVLIGNSGFKNIGKRLFYSKSDKSSEN